ncbi:MAG: hypothetical protein ACKOKB_01355, partial [Bacteroidota bacterium]
MLSKVCVPLAVKSSAELLISITGMMIFRSRISIVLVRLENLMVSRSEPLRYFERANMGLKRINSLYVDAINNGEVPFK